MFFSGEMEEKIVGRGGMEREMTKGDMVGIGGKDREPTMVSSPLRGGLSSFLLGGL